MQNYKKILAAFLFPAVLLTGQLCHAQNSVPPSQLNVVTGDEATTDEIFGVRGGYIHPYLSVRGEYTDNLYNIDVDEITNLLTVIAPGIWFGLPRTKDIPVSISHYNEAVGGKRYSVPGSGSFDRFQVYLMGGLNYKNYSYNSDLNYAAWHIEGMVQYKLPAGLSFRVQDRVTRDRDRFDLGSFLREDFTVEQDEIFVTSTPSRIRDYYSNQAVITVNFDMSEKFTALFDFTNFYLDYDESVNAWLDRTDNRFSLSLGYNHSPKTTLFVEYSQAFTSYSSQEDNNSDNFFMYGGINWKGSAKSSLMAKGGYQLRKYESFDQDEIPTFTMEVMYNYLITEKSKLSFNLYKALEETDSLLNRGRDTTTGRLRYTQKFSQRINAYCELWYEYNDYRDFSRLDGTPFQNEARRDTRFMVKPAVQYLFQDWLMAELAYSFENRDSNTDFYDFTTNTVFLSLNAAF